MPLYIYSTTGRPEDIEIKTKIKDKEARRWVQFVPGNIYELSDEDFKALPDMIKKKLFLQPTPPKAKPNKQEQKELDAKKKDKAAHVSGKFKKRPDNKAGQSI